MKNDKKVGIKHRRVDLEMPEDLYREMVMQTVWRNISIKRYIITAIIEQMKRDKKYQ